MSAITDLSICIRGFVNMNVPQVVETVVYACLGTLVTLVGVPTNIINCLLFWRQGLRDRMNVCLFSLSLAHGSFFVIVFFTFPVASIIRLHDLVLSQEYFSKVTLALTGVARGFYLTSSIINMAVAVDTCVCVVFPHRAASIMRTKTMASLIVSCFLLTQGCYVPFPFSYSAAKMSTVNCTYWFPVYTQFYDNNKLFLYLFRNVTLETVFPVVILTVVTVTTIVTVKTLRTAMMWRENTSCVANNIQRRQVALNKMLTMVAIVFIVTYIPHVACQLSFWFVVDRFSDSYVTDQFMAVISITSVVYQVNGCLNIFIYYHRSSRFREESHSLLRCLTSHPSDVTKVER
ncbi:uncharacterized protein LOC112566170 [Pomacea canaliculata]|uniref:uncharacterized protein LOC112566170 n=1 Tax=Pomacea canaliculata TaxID=400727 RepID=UPI000D72CAC3|nr:uncharacterized protein LOC112566170 [Pomacea canaliculata]